MVPLILTLHLDEASFQYFNQLRKAHFPPERNFIAAHLTLFHHLPDTPELRQQLAGAAGTQQPLQLEVTGLRSLGGGVAFRLHCPPLQAWHRQLQQQWFDLLTPQDRQPLQPHITVQNKVMPPAARQLLQQLEAGFTPFHVQAAGVQLWAYMGGPWQLLQDYPFASSSGQAAAV
ncbi:2'-5' RNA ligase superfamily protein [Cnuella takakiae]|uniref:2'-5' RNA ligase superfamily protein n=1 Tax=Cnuella takakiae TaxID=1302690 RepID=A0A1M5F9T6_9BACT|nr:2'-5' RNA ligase family protein [Cnuella takakiae]OLY91025.1 hypothetical protein BUE76_03265 [Cnuella takakiae]SHF88239.1 2'-5' RNA ligase superfamily protein [Cnuella takakiae]